MKYAWEPLIYSYSLDHLAHNRRKAADGDAAMENLSP